MMDYSTLAERYAPRPCVECNRHADVTIRDVPYCADDARKHLHELKAATAHEGS